jgi:hypothetical protein
MKTLTTAALLTILSCVFVAMFQRNVSARRSSEPPANTAAAEERPLTPVPVIVELFTSEGCSSCPPADALLMQLEAEQPFAGSQVLALEEHVDYWNDLGWVDPFSSAELTERQRGYAEALSHGSAYTPQMVVNGQWEFVGSRSNQASQTIIAAAKEPRSEVAIASALPNADAGGEWTIRVNRLMANSGDAAEVWMAVTETHLRSSVARGENSGRDLSHAAVVRQLVKLGVADPRKDPPFIVTTKPNLRPEWKRENLRFVVFVQQRKSRHILGAASATPAP